MTLATLKGRLQTKLVSHFMLAVITIPFALFISTEYIALFALAVLVGLVLETIWGYIIVHQPGWAAFVLAAIEFVAIASIAPLLAIQIPLSDALIYYVTSWVIIQLTFLYVIPIFWTSWADDGAEFW